MGGGSSSNGIQGYTYKAAIMAALCEGPIAGIKQVWQNKARTTMSKLALSLAPGDIGQASWGYLTSKHAAEAVGYSGLCHVDSAAFNLGTSADLPSLSFEVYGFLVNKVVTQASGAPVWESKIGSDWWTISGTGYIIKGSTLVLFATQKMTDLDPIRLRFTTSAPSFNVVVHYDDNTAATFNNVTSGQILTLTGYGAGILQINVTRGDTTEYTITNIEIADHLTTEIATFETLPGKLDAVPADIVADFLTNALYGSGFPSARLGALTDYATYCKAANLLLSPAFTEQKPAAEHLRDIFQATNSEPVWSQGVLNVVPYADATITGNGVTFTPNLTPIYDLNDDDFVSDGEDPITCSRITTADAFNHVQIEFVNRAKDYNIEIAEAKDQADIEAKGLRTKDPILMHHICDASVARAVAQLILQRELFIRNTYRFTLTWRHCLLEPMDLVTITDAAMGLIEAPVRIKEIEEDEEGLLSIVAEEYPFGVNSHAIYEHQAALGYIPDYQVSPGNANEPLIFEPPYQIAGATGLEVWIATSGGPEWGGCEVWVSEDNISFTKAGSIDGSARHGVLSYELPAGLSPDPATPLDVDLTVSRGNLLSGTQQDADNLNTLCYVGGELIAYQTATLTDVNKYRLTYLQRGAYKTTIAAHAAGSKFARLDGHIFKFPFRKDQIGRLIFVKLVSYNIYKGAVQSLADVTAFSYTITGYAIYGMPPADVTGFQAIPNKSFVDLKWAPNADFDFAGYEVRFGASWDAGEVLVTNHSSSQFQWQPSQSGTLQWWIKAIDSSGNYSVNAATATLAIQAPIATEISQQVVDNNVLLRWTNNQGTFAIEYAEVRKGLTFETAEVIGRFDGTFTTIFETASNTYKYWVVLKDIAGLYGPANGTYATVSQPPDFILRDQRALSWATGTKTNCVIDADKNNALVAPVDATQTWQAHFTSRGWTTPQDQINAGYPVFAQPGVATGSYVETIDYGVTIPNSKITLDLTRTTPNGTVTVTPTLSISTDGISWTDYAGVYQAYGSNFRYVKIRLDFATSDGGVVSIDSTNLRLDLKQKTLAVNVNLPSTTGTGDQINFADYGFSFIDVESIVPGAPFLNNTSYDPVTVIYNFTDTPNPTGFKGLAYDKNGNRIALTGTNKASFIIRGV